MAAAEIPLEHSHFHKLSRFLWGGVVALIVILAIYVSFGRLLMSNMGPYEVQILREINARVPFTLEAQKVSGEWHSFSPEVVLTGLVLSIPGSTVPPFELEEGRITFDVLESLLTLSLKISKLQLEELSLQGELNEDGTLSIAGLSGGDGQVGEWLQQFLLNIETINLENNWLNLTLPDEQERLLKLDLVLRRDGSSRHLEANIFSQTTGTTIFALAHGVGSPLAQDAFVGELYLKVKVSDLGAFQQLVKRSPAIKVQGKLDAEVWLAWDKGDPSIALTLDGTELSFTSSEDNWSVPAERVSMQATLVEKNDHWTVFASDFELYTKDVRVLLPKFQLDTWGDSLRLRASGVPLAPLNDYLVQLSLTPDAIADVFEVLDTQGEISSAQLEIADLQFPSRDWQLSANFNQLDLKPWRGAPGVTAAKGYVDLAPEGGYVILDSQAFSMDFPTVYQHPLSYDDIFGTINISWDEDAFNLSSGLVTVTGEEGVAYLLFGLNIPLIKSDVGLEMDLLVGLKGFDPKYRDKYLPYILSDALLGWLRPSIGEGNIEQGAFLWRGSLLPEKPDLKTIQLFFNVADTHFKYQPDWPPITVVNGIVLIDDTNVSVWSQDANLYRSKIEYLSVEAWSNSNSVMELAVAGVLRGSAADGLAVVNNSPLTTIVDGVFEAWKVDGVLKTDLKLQLVLGDTQLIPEIEVDTQWTNVDLHVDPGNIALTHINGQFSYNSDDGFHSKKLTGKLWGESFAAEVKQNDKAISVAMHTRVDMSDIRNWLDLDMLAFAKGKTDASIVIRVVPGEGTVLTHDSDMLGVELDLPEPWGKASSDVSSLHITFPLGGEYSVLEIDLNDNLHMNLQLNEGVFAGAALSFFEPPRPMELGVLRISGHTPLIDANQWQQFVAQYIGDEMLATTIEQEGLSFEVGALGADTFLFMGQDLADVVVSHGPVAHSTITSIETEWFSGGWIYEKGEQRAQLNVQYLDLEQLESFNFDDSEGEVIRVPDIAVSLAGIYFGSQQLGEVEFGIKSEGDIILAHNIAGTIAGLSIDPNSPAILSWDQGGKTSLSGRFEFEDLGASFERLGYQKIVETETGELNVTLNWPGNPANFSLSEAEGSVLLTLGKGRFLDTPSGASGALRVVSILNLAEIVSGLSLTHMFESGIPFRSVDGEVFLYGGTLEVASFEVDGSSSGFQFSGVADIASKSLEGNLVVTLPVANNLPWVVALAAGLPVAAGVFVVSQVFKKQVNRFSSGVYRVSGTWDDPQVKFARIFDNAAVDTDSSERSVVPEPRDPNQLSPQP